MHSHIFVSNLPQQSFGTQQSHYALFPNTSLVLFPKITFLHSKKFDPHRGTHQRHPIICVSMCQMHPRQIWAHLCSTSLPGTSCLTKLREHLTGLYLYLHRVLVTLFVNLYFVCPCGPSLKNHSLRLSSSQCVPEKRQTAIYYLCGQPVFQETLFGIPCSLVPIHLLQSFRQVFSEVTQLSICLNWAGIFGLKGVFETTHTFVVANNVSVVRH